MISEAKKLAAIENLKKANAKNKSKPFGIWKCKTCQKEARATIHQLRKTYCSNACMSQDYKVRLLGQNNPHYSDASKRICEICQKTYKSYQKTTRFCSMGCRDKNGLSAGMRHNAKKDDNHNEIVGYLEAGGAFVIDCSKMMHGMSDLLVWHIEQWHLVEIKNPKTSYGKKGLNPSQMKFANNWQGGPVYIVRTKEDVDSFLIGEFEKIDKVGGYSLTTNCDKAKW
jgi:endogenous inhibitor of DNA gyrase (YacG/DUF329 family)